MKGIPFQERKTVLRGMLDLVSGAYPGFLFGGPLGRILPVFHFHDVTRDGLRPYFAYLAENGYETVTADTVAGVARGEIPVGDRQVALCFDDAWASLWSVVLPLLDAYGLRAITYIAPGRIEEAEACRPVADADDASPPTTGPPFVTWPEINALHASGRVDVQAHTHSHAMMFCADRITGFVTPDTTMPLLSWPLYTASSEPEFLSAAAWGQPLFQQRSRFSDARRFYVDPAVQERCKVCVRDHGGSAFFERGDWEATLREAAAPVTGRFESDDERDTAIRRDVSRCRDILETVLSKSVTQICMPWAVCGQRAEHLVREAGYQSMVADALFGRRYVHPGANPYRLMRLKHRYIAALPGKGRQTLLRMRRGGHHA